MSENIKVSIICNTYNHGSYIRDALEGFVMQKTDFPFEVLVHDDASPDNTSDIIREYEAKYPDIIKPIYQTENLRKKGVLYSRVYQDPRINGKYVAICEGDDYWTDPEKLQKQYDFLENNPEYTMCACSTVWLDMTTGKRLLNKCSTDADRDVTMDEIIEEKNGRILQYATIMVHTDVWKDWPEWRSAFPVGDLPLLIKAALKGKIRMLADCMAVYRFQAPGSWTSKIKSNERFIDIKTRMCEGLERLNEATEFKYDRVIKNRILLNKYTIAIAKGDLKAMRSGELADVYKSRSAKQKIGDILKCKTPKIHALVKKFI